MYYPHLCSFALKYVGTSEDAEEIVQEVFFKVWENVESIAIKTSLKSYLYGAVRNGCFNFIKHQKVKLAHAEHEKHVRQNYFQKDLLEIDELREAILNAVDKLPERCREIFELSKYEGKKYKEIADQLNISIKTVENQMGKALKMLREDLAPYLPMLAFLEILNIILTSS